MPIYAYDIGSLNAYFGGSGTSLSSFYRGGGRVPATRSTPIVVREPTSGEAYNRATAPYAYWVNIFNSGSYAYTAIIWESVNIINPGYGMQATTTYTGGGVTYYRGPKMSSVITVDDYYALYRTYPSTQVTDINLGVPSSGAISLSQLYGAENS